MGNVEVAYRSRTYDLALFSFIHQVQNSPTLRLIFTHFSYRHSSPNSIQDVFPSLAA